MLSASVTLFFPPLSPPPLSAPRRGQRGEPGFGFWFFGQASTERGVATVAGRPRFHVCGRSQWRYRCVPPTAAALRPAVSEKRRSGACTAGLVAGRRSRQPWRVDSCEFSTTVGVQVEASEDARDLTRRSSVAGAKKQNPGSPLYPGGGREGRGGEWGITKATNHKPPHPQAGCSTRTNERRTPASKRSYQEGFCTTSAR